MLDMPLWGIIWPVDGYLTRFGGCLIDGAIWEGICCGLSVGSGECRTGGYAGWDDHVVLCGGYVSEYGVLVNSCLA